MSDLEIRACLALLNRAMQLMDVEGSLRNRILIKQTSRVYVETSFTNRNEVDLFGFFPNGRNKTQLIKSAFSQEAVEGLAYICFDIVSSHGYNTFKQKKATDLKMLLGNQYNSILNTAEKNGLIRIRKTETEYYSNKRECFHTEIAVIGRKGSFNRRVLKNSRAIERIKKYLFNKLEDVSKNALLKTRESQLDLVVCNEKFTLQNLGLEHGFFLPSVDKFGKRIHSFVTNLDKSYREELRNILYLDEPLVEVDLKSSHPYLLLRLLINPYCLVYAFEDSEVLKQFADILEDHYYNDELLVDMQLSIDKGRFYEDFFLYLLEDSIENWRSFILEKHLKEKPEDKNKEFTEKELCKLAFMYVVNGGAKPILEALHENERYRNFVSLILVMQKSWIKKGSKEIRKLKKPYLPHKNLPMILQRIESKAMQTAYNSLNGIWGLLLHDSIVCMDKDKERVKQAIMAAYLSLDLGMPEIKFKNL